MVLKGVVRMFIIVGLFAGSLAAITPSVAAHDNDCLVAVHAGPVKQHVQCDPRKRDSSNCLASAKVMFIHQRVACD